MGYIKSEELIKYIDEKGAKLGLTNANICNFKEIVRLLEAHTQNHNNLCVVCGNIIPEGIQVCPMCNK